MKKFTFLAVALSFVASIAFAGGLSQKDVRNPRFMEPWLEEGKITSSSIANGAGIHTQALVFASYTLAATAVNTQRFSAATSEKIVVIKNDSTNAVTIDVAAGDVTLGDNDCVTLGYLGSEWIVVSTKDN